MTLADVLLLALSLAMDCFTVSIVCGAILRRWLHGPMLRTALLFGLFQALMPLLGWLAMRLFAARVEVYGHWIAFALLFFIGARMIWQSVRADDAPGPLLRPERLATQLLLAVATSIDALAVGISMAVVGYSTLRSLALPLVVIGSVSFLMSVLGHGLGIRFGRAAGRRFRPELLGGIILVLLSVRVLLL